MVNVPYESLRKHENAKERREYLEKKLHVKLENIGKPSLDEDQLVGSNIENLIGAVQVPVGIAGPIDISGDYAKGTFYLPLATTEGALVASVSRGCKAITLSGGTNAYSYRMGQTRGPV